MSARARRPGRAEISISGLPPLLTLIDPPSGKKRSRKSVCRILHSPIEDSADLEDPDVIAEEIADDLQAALEQFAAIAADLRDREPAG